MIGPQRCALLLAGLAVFIVDAGSRHGDLRLSERVRQRALAMPAPAADDRRADVFVRTRFTRCEAWCSWRGFLSNAPTLESAFSTPETASTQFQPIPRLCPRR